MPLNVYSYLNDHERVTSLHYLPSDGNFSHSRFLFTLGPEIDPLPSHTDDVLKARLKTVGVSEYKFQMEAGSEQGTEWRIIDVGGSRSQVRRLHLVSILTFFTP